MGEFITIIVIAAIIVVPLFIWLMSILVEILKAARQAAQQIAKIIPSKEIEVKLLNQASETTQIPAPKGSLDCSHTWKVVTREVLEAEDEKKLVVIQVCELCGLVDKTIETVVKEKPKSECRHKWIRQDVKLPSAFQQAEELVRKAYSSWSKKDLRESKPWFYRTRYVCTLTCEHCGEVKTITASNIDSDDFNGEEGAE